MEVFIVRVWPDPGVEEADLHGLVEHAGTQSTERFTSGAELISLLEIFTRAAGSEREKGRTT
jgi:hypothetical protein